ncbi:uncharacterized protein TEOVI_000024400 [Trypanosoma equiperdum]|uniref:Uncharacterized protein n=4 Tax=Trypanozoon TaxID=39700 RepID=Q57YE5_TRYB2|nr:hypothetical protein, conserved [Trypanosoma brucei gambiense DAL972]XP_846923.1 hypothetical protein, conserved [Trypanosoma brucei brucei TREU927]AAX69374.1 hypothetical protein, conserved [Trypanosoma brucei]RHW70742.1 hypothetical protein DPX39_080008400 [Trypanosoma brucei equiperdum]SCU65870.1 hypothetical protein, conserved [Trypanosoma equiperdum]AAZ12857.1 hypothetical protein, conserved [Trypanosoma brucei brucei TREU927]CBH13095.1 hypothetical protein, conserved [Trypanosoma bru|eukprot:XP_011775372.1 hypothetical protein, conserved [Trypanosoma brucei gambiense DAL972]
MYFFFFQVIDREKLAYASNISIILELLCAVLIFVLIGVFLRVAPLKWAHFVAPRRVNVCRAELNIINPKVEDALESTAVERPKENITNVKRHKEEDSRGNKISPIVEKTTNRAEKTSRVVRDISLEDTLDEFFREEQLLHDTLLDVETDMNLHRVEIEPTMRLLSPPKVVNQRIKVPASPEKRRENGRGKVVPVSKVHEKSLDEALECFFNDEELLEGTLQEVF